MQPKKVEVYHAMVQELPQVIPFHLAEDQRRHGANSSLVYDKEMRADEEECEDRYEVGVGRNFGKESVGLCHLIHGRLQRGNPQKGLFVSGDISHSSSSGMACAAYYHLTAPVTLYIAALFKAFMPKVYRKYRRAFAAGAWVPGDSGPFLGRSIIYKLQGVLHTDGKDIGPSLSFPVGFFEGGTMSVPQLGSKFL